jgi:hypothetical protein
MRTLNKNTQKMYYANQDRVVPIYEYYEDEDGNTIPLDTGETKLVYGEPIEFKGNISLSNGGEVEVQEFGLDIGSYSAILVTNKNYINLSETSLVWHSTEPTKDIDGNTNEFSADYRVVKVSDSLNVSKYALQKVVK